MRPYPIDVDVVARWCGTTVDQARWGRPRGVVDARYYIALAAAPPHEPLYLAVAIWMFALGSAGRTARPFVFGKTLLADVLLPELRRGPP